MNKIRNLLIEDSTQTQNSIADVRWTNDIVIEVPKNPDDLKEVWRKNQHFEHSMIDFRLSAWQLPIVLGKEKCWDGVDIAQQINKKDPKTLMAMYSSNLSGLKEKLNQNTELYQKTYTIELESPQMTTQEKIIEFYTCTQKITIKPLQKDHTNLPIAIQVALNKYISEPRNKGEYLLKIGDYSWHAGINQGITNRFSDITEKFDEGCYTDNNKLLQYMVDLDEQDFSLKTLSFNGKRIGLDHLADQQETHLPPYHLNQYLYVKKFCEKYVKGDISEDDLKHILSTPDIRDEYKLECQSILFKKYKHQAKQLQLENFPQIIDIFKGRVDKIHGRDAYVILHNIVDKTKMSIIKVDTDYLKSNHLEEDSQFEYCLYKNSIGDIVPHVEPNIIY